MSDDDDRNPAYWERLSKRRTGLFALTPIIVDILIIAALLAGYHYIMTRGLFPEWLTYIYWTMKVVVAFEVLAASARSMLAPLLGLIAGVGILYAIQVYDFSLFTTPDAWQLIVVSLIGFLVTIVVKL